MFFSLFIHPHLGPPFGRPFRVHQVNDTNYYIFQTHLQLDSTCEIPIRNNYATLLTFLAQKIVTMILRLESQVLTLSPLTLSIRPEK